MPPHGRATLVAGPGARRNHRAERSAELSRPLDQIPAARWQELSFEGKPPYATFAASQDLFGDRSVVLIPGGGHTREDVLAFAMLAQGPILLAGDAIEYREWLDSDDVQRIPDAPERAAAVRNEVRALLRADPSVLLLPGHDMRVLSSDRSDVVLHHPEWFALESWPTP
jgi:glyoxylase-like metal-dependent hydrolase (beta-lactamase superfamily II)